MSRTAAARSSSSPAPSPIRVPLLRFEHESLGRTVAKLGDRAVGWVLDMDYGQGYRALWTCALPPAHLAQPRRSPSVQAAKAALAAFVSEFMVAANVLDPGQLVRVLDETVDGADA